MKPTNFQENGCDPMSSDCVIWQGPDIECISLCKGDSVSTVVAKLATELCNLIDIFNIDNFDLSCFNSDTCAPEDFEALINFLIERICALEGIEPPTPGESSGDCPDNCIVNICEEFHYVNELGDTVTTMSLTDYVTAIGNRVCQLIGEINTINATLENHEERITALENAEDPTLELPKVTPVCVIEPPAPTDMNVVLAALETQFCELIGATGSSIDIYTAITKQCQNLANDDALGGSGTMNGIEGWQGTVTNLSAAINNIWLTICDIRSAIKTIQATCCTTNCDGVDVTIGYDLTGNVLSLTYTGTIPNGFAECLQSGTRVTITDQNGASTIQYVPLIGSFNSPTGYDLDLTGTPIDTSLNLTIVHELCFTDGNSECSSIETYEYLNSATCPVLTVTPLETSINFQFTWTSSTPASVAVKLFASDQTTQLSVQNFPVTGFSLETGSFTGLVGSTDYYIGITYTLDNSKIEVDCPLQLARTADAACIPPTTVQTQGVKRQGEAGYGQAFPIP